MLLAACSLTLVAPGCGDDSDGDTTGGGTTTTATGTGTGTGTGTNTGTGATCMVDICTKYGAAVPQVASDITDRAAMDSMFMDDFAPLVMQGNQAVQDFKDSLTAFISDAYGCSMNTYTGPSMEEAHMGMNITQQEYDAFLDIIVQVLLDTGVEEEDVTNCFAPPLTSPEFASTIVGQ